MDQALPQSEMPKVHLNRRIEFNPTPWMLAAFGAVYVALALISYTLNVERFEVYLMWPPAGLYLVALATARASAWLKIMPVAYAAEIAADWLADGVLDPPLTFAIPLANAVQAAFGAWLLRTLVPQPWQRRQSIEVMAYVAVTALITPVVGATIALGEIAATGVAIADALQEFGAWWASDMIGILMVAPIFGGFILQATTDSPLFNARTLQAVLILAATVTAWWLLLGLPEPADGAGNGRRLLLASIVTVVGYGWLALRAQPGTVAVACFIGGVFVCLLLGNPNTLIGEVVNANRFRVQSVQFGMLTVSLGAFLLSLALFERHNVRELMRKRGLWGLEFAKLATALSNCNEDNVDRRITDGLEKIGRYARADRCKLLLVDYGGDTFSETLSWQRSGIANTRRLLQQLPLDAVRDSFERIARGDTFYANQSSLPADSAHGKILRQTGAQTSAYAPIREDGEVIGALTLSWTRREVRVSNETSILLQSSAQLIGETYARVAAERRQRIYRDKLRELTATLDTIDEKVRREAAYDLHDGAAQVLAIARVRLARLRAEKDPDNPELKTLETLLNEAITSIREIVARMAPAALYELGLREALTAFVDEMSAASHIDVTLSFDCDIGGEPTASSLLIYRIVRELVTNALKHAAASHVAVAVTHDAQVNRVDIAVIDDGSGLDEQHIDDSGSRGSGIGLFGLREKLRRSGGTMQFEPTTRGSKVTATFDPTIVDAAAVRPSM